MTGYVIAIRSLSSGRAKHSMEFHSYAEVPADIKEYILNVGRFTF